MAAETAAAPRSDIRDLLVESAHLSLDQLPLLQVIFDRAGQLVAERLRALSSTLPLVSMHSLTTGRTGDMLDAYEMKAVVGMFHVVGWDTRVLVGFDRDFVFTMVETLLGGDGSEAPLEDIRNLSSIEVGLSQFVLEQVGNALQAALTPVSATRFRFERAETRMDFAGAGRRAQPAVIARFVLQALNRGGEMFVIVPQSALAPLRHALARFPAREAAATADPAWVENLSQNARRTEVAIRALAEAQDLTLGDVAGFKVGQLIKLDASTQRPVRVESNDHPLFWAFLGQNHGCHTLCIDAPIDSDRELIDEVLST